MNKDFLLVKLAASIFTLTPPIPSPLWNGVAAIVGAITAWLVGRGILMEGKS